MNNLTQMKQQRTSIIIISIILIAAIVGVSVYFLQQRTVTNPHAAASTTVAFTAPTTAVSSGQQISSDITVDPGNNQVSLVKLVLTYDSSQLQIASDASSLVANQTAFPQTLEPPTTSCNGTQCMLSATFSIGSNPTNAIQTKTKLATFNATVLAADQTPITVGFDQTTAVYSIATTDQANENVLSSTVPLSFTVGSTLTTSNGPTPTTAGTCSMSTATCAWDTLTGAGSYHYKITDTTTSNTIKEGDITPPQSSVDFPQTPGDTYTCVVSAASVCGTTGQTATTTNTCPINPTVTPTIKPTVTPTPTMTLTPTMTPTPAPTTTPVPTATPYPTLPPAPTNPPAQPQQPAQPAQPQQPAQPPQYIAAAPTATPKPQAPKMMPTGPGDTLIKVGIGGVVLAIVGGLLVFGL
jgi:hypothetical protein